MVVRRFEHRRDAWREERGPDAPELVEAAADHETYGPEEYLVLQVRAELKPARSLRGDVQRERVVPNVGSVAENVAVAHEARVADVEVDRAVRKPERDGSAPGRRVSQKKARRHPFNDVREHLQAEIPPVVAQLAVADVRAPTEVEGAEPGVRDTLRGTHAARVRELAPAIEILIDPEIQLGLGRPAVHVRPAERPGAVGRVVRPAHHPGRHPGVCHHGNAADGAGKRGRPEVPGADAVRERVARGPAHGHIRDRAEPRTRPRRGPHVPVRPARAHGHGGPDRLPRGLRDEVDRPRHGVGPPGHRRGPADDLDLLDVVGADGKGVPQDHPKEVQVDAPAVHEDELGVGEDPGRLPTRDLDVAGRQLHDVQPRHPPEGITDSRAGLSDQRVTRNHRRRHRGVHHPDAAPAADGTRRPEHDEVLGDLVAEPQRHHRSNGRAVEGAGLDKTDREPREEPLDRPPARTHRTGLEHPVGPGQALEGRAAGAGESHDHAGKNEALRIGGRDHQRRRLLGLEYDSQLQGSRLRNDVLDSRRETLAHDGERVGANHHRREQEATVGPGDRHVPIARDGLKRHLRRKRTTKRICDGARDLINDGLTARRERDNEHEREDDAKNTS